MSGLMCVLLLVEAGADGHGWLRPGPPAHQTSQARCQGPCDLQGPVKLFNLFHNLNKKKVNFLVEEHILIYNVNLFKFILMQSTNGDFFGGGPADLFIEQMCFFLIFLREGVVCGQENSGLHRYLCPSPKNL